MTLAFWVIKILVSTLGETGGDALSMTMHLGYAVSTGIFLAVFFLAIAAQVRAESFNPFLYWPVVIATTTAGGDGVSVRKLLQDRNIFHE